MVLFDHSQLPLQGYREQTLWGQTVCRVWLPNQDAVVRVLRSALRSLTSDLHPEIESHRIAYIAAAARLPKCWKAAQTHRTAMCFWLPWSRTSIPLPHQIHALSRAISGDRVRYLLADEVGLGKTIEAGLVMRELKLRGLVRRTLVVAQKGLATQWVAEMQAHFNEEFQLILGENFQTLKRISPTLRTELSRSDSQSSVLSTQTLRSRKSVSSIQASYRSPRHV